jgi:hypothetical protein
MNSHISTRDKSSRTFTKSAIIAINALGLIKALSSLDGMDDVKLNTKDTMLLYSTIFELAGMCDLIRVLLQSYGLSHVECAVAGLIALGNLGTLRTGSISNQQGPPEDITTQSKEASPVDKGFISGYVILMSQTVYCINLCITHDQ